MLQPDECHTNSRRVISGTRHRHPLASNRRRTAPVGHSEKEVIGCMPALRTPTYSASRKQHSRPWTRLPALPVSLLSALLSPCPGSRAHLV